MIDLDQKLHRSLVALAEARPVATPPLVSIFEGADDNGARERRPRRVLVAAVAGGLTLGVGGAALAGVLPGPVTDAFHRMSDWGGPCHIDKTDARMVASTRMPNGSTLEWWSAPTAKTGQVDDFTRIVSASGRSHHVETMSCAPRVDATSKVVLGGGSTTPKQVDLWGQAPIGTAALSVTLSDGASAPLTLQGDRYFMHAFTTSAGAPHPVTVTARAADGTVIDSLNVDVPSGPRSSVTPSRGS
jgi:hypothetical protein